MERRRCCRRYSTAVTKSQKLRKAFTLCFQLLRWINFLLKHFIVKNLEPLYKYFKYRFIFTDKISCLWLFDISRFLIKASIEQEPYASQYPYLLILECTFHFFFWVLWSPLSPECLRVSSFPSVELTLQVLLQDQDLCSVCNPLLSSRMSFTEVFPGRMSLQMHSLCCPANRKALVCTWKHPQAAVAEVGGHEFHWCPFLGWRPGWCILMVKGLTVGGCSTISGWTQVHSLWLSVHLFLQVPVLC